MTEHGRAHVIISGRVQGVFFRMETRRTAERLGVAGWVRNLPDGTVEAVFEGSPEAVQKAVEWCRKGPARAEVRDVRTTWEKSSGEFGGFRIQ
ncbi:MAG: acylphosphatase [Desulfobacteraceae bacterium]|nr:MAG: acylphosphatase [Desulfobacteraceae bacterium]